MADFVFIQVLKIFSILLTSHLWCQAAESGSACEPMGRHDAPLGTVWVQDLENKLKSYHLRMVEKELSAVKLPGIKIQTNIALFGLNVRTKQGTLISILDRTTQNFSSGGRALTDPEKEALEDVGGKRKRLRDDIETKQKLMLEKMEDVGQLPKKHMRQVDVCLEKLDETAIRVQNLRDGVNQHKQELDQLQQMETDYAPDIFSGKPEYKDYTNAIYDPEQTITRIVDFHMERAHVDTSSITINGQRFDQPLPAISRQYD